MHAKRHVNTLYSSIKLNPTITVGDITYIKHAQMAMEVRATIHVIFAHSLYPVQC